jgi:hypothetical protein
VALHAEQNGILDHAQTTMFLREQMMHLVPGAVMAVAAAKKGPAPRFELH